jgi:antitoxin component YwqK of YwqJK toxin-antitoxin module
MQASIALSQNVIQNGQKQGNWHFVDQEGHWIKCFYINDTLDGRYEMRSEYNKRKKSIVVTYDKGILNGPFTYYWTNGKKKEEGYFKNGEKEGIVKEYDLKGRYTSFHTYYRGAFHGLCRSFDNAGRKEFDVWYYYGIRSDTLVWYSAKGDYMCMNITRRNGISSIPHFLLLKNTQNAKICILNIKEWLGNSLDEYDYDPIEERRFFWQQKRWVGLIFKHNSTRQVKKLYFKDVCRQKNSKPLNVK